VVISGATVLVAMAGMLLAGSGVFTSLGIGAMIVVFVSMLGSLTVLPALLAKLGDRIDRGVVAVAAAGIGRVLRREPRWVAYLRTRRTLLQRIKGTRAESRVWGAILRPSLRHPATAALLSTAFLVALAVPAFGMKGQLQSAVEGGKAPRPHEVAAVVLEVDGVQLVQPTVDPETILREACFVPYGMRARGNCWILLTSIRAGEQTRCFQSDHHPGTRR
jgi:RND superfamily putative drug exporter